MKERRRLSIPSLVDIRASFVGKMAVSGSHNKDTPVPPYDVEDLEKNWDSVSTIGNQCAELLGMGGKTSAAWQSTGSDSSHRKTTDLFDELMADGEANKSPPPKASKRPSAIMRRISEGMEEEDKMESMRLEIIDLKAKLDEKAEAMVKLEVELEMALEDNREAKEEKASCEASVGRSDGKASEEASRSSNSKAASAYDLYSLKSRVKDLEMENKRLKERLGDNGAEDLAGVAPPAKEAEKPLVRQQRGSRVRSLRRLSLSSVPNRVNFRTKSSKSVTGRRNTKKDEKRRVINHIASSAPPPSSTRAAEKKMRSAE